MKSELSIRRGDYYLFVRMGTSHILRCQRACADGAAEFIDDRSGLSLRLGRRLFSKLVRKGEAILVCPAIQSRTPQPHEREPVKREPPTRSYVPRYGQVYLISMDGSVGRYVFQGFLPGSSLHFACRRTLRLFAMKAERFESLRRRGRAVPVMEEETPSRSLRFFEPRMTRAKGFNSLTQHTGQRRH